MRAKDNSDDLRKYALTNSSLVEIFDILNGNYDDKNQRNTIYVDQITVLDLMRQKNNDFISDPKLNHIYGHILIKILSAIINNDIDYSLIIKLALENSVVAQAVLELALDCETISPLVKNDIALNLYFIMTGEWFSENPDDHNPISRDTARYKDIYYSMFKGNYNQASQQNLNYRTDELESDEEDNETPSVPAAARAISEDPTNRSGVVESAGSYGVGGPAFAELDNNEEFVDYGFVLLRDDAQPAAARSATNSIPGRPVESLGSYDISGPAFDGLGYDGVLVDYNFMLSGNDSQPAVARSAATTLGEASQDEWASGSTSNEATVVSYTSSSAHPNVIITTSSHRTNESSNESSEQVVIPFSATFSIIEEYNSMPNPSTAAVVTTTGVIANSEEASAE